MKRILLIALCIIFVKNIYAQTPQPLSDRYIGCLGYTIKAGFEHNNAISYAWYATQTGGALLFSSDSFNFPILTSGAPGGFNYPTPGFTHTFWVQVTINGVVQPARIPVVIERGDNCGETNPSGCYSTGTLLYKEDFGGNSPTAPAIGNPLPAGTTTYTWNTTLSGHGVYMIGKSTPYATHSTTWYNLTDHTGGGYLFAVDASEETGQFYQCAINGLCPNTRLSFSAWLVNMCSTSHTAKANLVFIVEDAATHENLARFYTGNIPDVSPTWKNYGFSFIPTSSNIILKILNNNTSGTDGNDFAMDDIEIRICTPQINVPNPPDSICRGSSMVVPAMFINDGSFAEPVSYQWYYSATGDLTNPAAWTPIAGQTTSTLNISSFQSSNTGYYRLAIAGAGVTQENCRAMSVPFFTAMKICDYCEVAKPITADICQGQTYNFYDRILNTAGIYKDTIHGVCDTIATLTLNVGAVITENPSLSICQSELPKVWRDTTFRAGTISGNYVFRRRTAAGCDSIVTLTLTLSNYILRNISKSICQGETYYFGGRNLGAAGIYKDTIPMAAGCDSIITLNLAVGQPITQTPTLTICQNDLPKVWRDTTFREDTESGIFIFHKRTAAGCDSTVTLTLTIKSVIETTKYDTICGGEPYIFDGRTLTESGEYTAVFTSGNGCDSTVTLFLEVIDIVNVNINMPAMICADDGVFNISFSQNSSSALPTNYQIVFGAKEINAGFVNQQGELAGNEIEVTMPEKIYPDNYSFKLILSDNTTDCPAKEFSKDFSVLYPDSIMEQKWNDVIALLNPYYNGGFRFAAYQWYHNGDKMQGETYSYIYLNGKSLVVGDKYQVEITREDGSQVFSCPFEAHEPRTQVSTFPTIVQPLGSIHIRIKGNSATVRIWSVTGILVASERLNSQNQSITAPAQQGMYILEIISNDTSREAVPIVVK